MNIKNITFSFIMFLFTINLFSQISQNYDTAILIGGPLGFRIGGKYRILQYRANVRSEPSINGNIIAILSLNDEVEIIEYSNNAEIINETHGFWIKIKRGNIIGYTFSGNLALRAYTTELLTLENDERFNDSTKEVTFSFYFRRSDPSYDNNGTFRGWQFSFDNFKNEIFIYINGQRINTEAIRWRHWPLDNIEFENGRNSVLIKLISESREGRDINIYRVRYDGRIDFIGGYGSWYPNWYIGD